MKRIPQNQTLAAAAESKSEVSQAPLYSIPTAQSLIQDVKAIFPDYGEFFISCVLEVISPSITPNAIGLWSKSGKSY